MLLAQTPPRLVTLILLAALTTLTLNMFLPSLPAIARDLDADYALVSLSVAGYLAITVLTQLVVGPLSDRIGRRPVILGALVVFVVSSLVCAVAQSIWVFLAARLLQSAMTAGYAVSLAIVRDTTPAEGAAAKIGYIAMCMAVAPMLGPVLGGVIDTWLGWRAIFGFYALTGVCLLIWSLLDLGETRVASDGRATGNALTLLAEPAFWAFALCGALSVGGFYVFITGVPVVAEAQFGLSAAGIGVAIGSITAGYMTGSFIAARLAPRFALTTMMLIGRCIACAGLAVGLFATLTFGVSLPAFFGGAICVGLGNGLTLPSTNAGAMSIRPDLAGTAAGLVGAITVGTGAAVTAITGALVAATPAPALVLWLMLAITFLALIAASVAHAQKSRASLEAQKRQL